VKKEIFPIVILTGRPASGKSEIIEFLSRLPEAERRERYHMGELKILDDFPLLWTWFEEDDILRNRLGQPRLYTDDRGLFLFPYLWDLLIERLSLEYQKLLRDTAEFHSSTTVLIEFSRGTEHGGYAQAFPHLSDEILMNAGLVYVNVPYSESLRKNRRRFNPDRPDSILEHGLPDWKLKHLYEHDDWETIAGADPEFIQVRSLQVPYVVFENEDDVTTSSPDQLARRLEKVGRQLWEMWSKRH
jgi:hypothetical protein